MMQVKEGERLRAMAQNMHIRHTVLPADRGNIYTEGNDLLCSTIPMFDVFIDFSVIDSTLFYEKVDSLSLQLATLFEGRTAASYKKALRTAYKSKERNKYWSLCKNIQYNEYQALRGFHIFNKGKNRGGFIGESKVNRINPYGMLAYRTIGLWREN